MQSRACTQSTRSSFLPLVPIPMLFCKPPTTSSRANQPAGLLMTLIRLFHVSAMRISPAEFKATAAG